MAPCGNCKIKYRQAHVAGVFSHCGETATATYKGDLKFDSGGARTKSPTGLFEYGPADATATHYLLLQ